MAFIRYEFSRWQIRDKSFSGWHIRDNICCNLTWPRVNPEGSILVMHNEAKMSLSSPNIPLT